MKTDQVWRFPFLWTLIPSCALLFADLAEDVWNKDGFTWDVPVALTLHHFARPWLDLTMYAISQTAGSFIVFIALLVAFWFWRRRQTLNAVALLVSFGGAMVLNTGLKLLFARMPPHLFPPLVVETDYSFPSGHTLAAVAVYGLLAVLLWRHRYYLAALLTAVWVGAVAVSRVYVGAHYPSDVLASLILGTLWLFAIFFVYDWCRQASPPVQTYTDAASPSL